MNGLYKVNTHRNEKERKTTDSCNQFFAKSHLKITLLTDPTLATLVAHSYRGEMWIQFLGIDVRSVQLNTVGGLRLFQSFAILSDKVQLIFYVYGCTVCF